MQTSAQPQPTVPAPTPTVTTVGPDGKPLTVAIPFNRAEVRTLLSQRQELSNQLVSASERRREIAEEIRLTSEGASKKGLEDRLGVLDKRILQLESDMAATGRQLAAAPAELVASARVANDSDMTLEPFFFAGGSALLGALVVILARRRWFRRTPTPTAKLSDDSARLERLEQGMEAIAIEVERISEGQRFVTRLLAETHEEAIPRLSERAGIKTPV
jgi:hypothetical protein